MGETSKRLITWKVLTVADPVKHVTHLELRSPVVEKAPSTRIAPLELAVAHLTVATIRDSRPFDAWTLPVRKLNTTGKLLSIAGSCNVWQLLPDRDSPLYCTSTVLLTLTAMEKARSCHWMKVALVRKGVEVHVR